MYTSVSHYLNGKYQYSETSFFFFFFVRFLLLLRTAWFLFSVYSFTGFLIPKSYSSSLDSKLCPCHSCTSSQFPILPWNLMLLLIISSVSATALYSPTFTSFLSAEKQTRAIFLWQLTCSQLFN